MLPVMLTVRPASPHPARGLPGPAVAVDVQAPTATLALHPGRVASIAPGHGADSDGDSRRKGSLESGSDLCAVGGDGSHARLHRDLFRQLTQLQSNVHAPDLDPSTTMLSCDEGSDCHLSQPRGYAWDYVRNLVVSVGSLATVPDSTVGLQSPVR